MTKTLSPDKEESAHTWFQVFIHSLTALCLEPEAACDMMGNYNSAGEIWYDLTAGAPYAPQSPVIGLDAPQRDAIAALVQKLKLLPPASIAPKGVMPISHAACVAALRHPAWTPLRQEAKAVVNLLEPAIARTEEYLARLKYQYLASL
jgi:hypothetical protein